MESILKIWQSIVSKLYLKKLLAQTFWKGSIFCYHVLVVRLLESPDVLAWKPWLNNRQTLLKKTAPKDHSIETCLLGSSCLDSSLLVVPLVAEQNSWSSSASPASLLSSVSARSTTLGSLWSQTPENSTIFLFSPRPRFHWETIGVSHCICLRHTAWWFDLHILWNDYHARFS